MELLEGDRLRNRMGGGAGETELAASKILLLGRDTPLVLKIGQAGLRDPQKAEGMACHAPVHEGTGHPVKLWVLLRQPGRTENRPSRERRDEI